MADIVAEAEIEATLDQKLHEGSESREIDVDNGDRKIDADSESREIDTDNGGNGHENPAVRDCEENGQGVDSKDEILPGKNLHVRNLSYSTTADMLREAFSRHGEILSVNVIKEPGTDKSRGFAFIGFASEQEGAAALVAMDGAEIDGRAIKVEESHRKKGHQKTPGRYMGPVLNHRDGRRDDDRDRRFNNDRRGGGGGFRRSNSRDRNRGGGSWGSRGGRSRSPARYRGEGHYRGDARDHRGGGVRGYDRRDVGRRSPPPGDRWGAPLPRRSRSRSRERMGGGYGHRR